MISHDLEGTLSQNFMARFIFEPSIYPYPWIEELSQKCFLIIGLFYPSVHSNPKNPSIKTFIFFIITFFGSLLASGYQKKRERSSRPKEENFCMLNLVVEKGASKDHDHGRS